MAVERLRPAWVRCPPPLFDVGPGPRRATPSRWFKAPRVLWYGKLTGTVA